jgi:hypothetical protein
MDTSIMRRKAVTAVVQGGFAARRQIIVGDYFM